MQDIKRKYWKGSKNKGKVFLAESNQTEACLAQSGFTQQCLSACCCDGTSVIVYKGSGDNVTQRMLERAHTLNGFEGLCDSLASRML